MHSSIFYFYHDKTSTKGIKFRLSKILNDQKKAEFTTAETKLTFLY